MSWLERMMYELMFSAGMDNSNIVIEPEEAPSEDSSDAEDEKDPCANVPKGEDGKNKVNKNTKTLTALLASGNSSMKNSDPFLIIGRLGMQAAKTLAVKTFWTVNVAPFGQWDYKRSINSSWANFGNFHYGATGRALGFSREILARSAGFVQVTVGSGQGPGMPWDKYIEGKTPKLGDNTDDWESLNNGMNYFDNKCHLRK
jgi:hypothetical protein